MRPKLLKYSRATLHIARAVNAIANEHRPVSSDRNNTDPESPSAVHKISKLLRAGRSRARYR